MFDFAWIIQALSLTNLCFEAVGWEVPEFEDLKPSAGLGSVVIDKY